MSNSLGPRPVPDAWQEGNLSYGAGLTLDIAKKMLEAAENEAKKQKLLMTISIVDSGGNLVGLYRMDNACLFSIQVSMDKAFTAVYGKLTTKDWGPFFQSSDLPPLFFHKRWSPFPGGFPLVRDGQIFGGIGVSGATTLGDSLVARAALVAGGFNTDAIDAILKEK
jgi:glc operon protein GlcG